MRLVSLILMSSLVGCAGHRAPVVQAPVVLHQQGDAGLTGELVIGGPLDQRVSADPADLVLFYGGEEKGSLEPCGCSNRPRGGLARQASYMTAAMGASPDSPALVVNGGYWLDDARSLDGSPRADVPVANQWMVTGLQQLGISALNVGNNDVGALSMQSAPPDLPLVSAHVVGPGISPWVTVDVGSLVVGITGVSAAASQFHQRPGYIFGHPIREARKTLKDLNDRVDVVILLAHSNPDAARSHAESGLVDVVIDTNQHRERYAPMRIGDAVWVRSHFGTMRVGELRLQVEDGRVVSAVDRKVDLDPELPEAEDLARIVAAARQDIDAAQRAAFGEVIGR